MNDNQPTAQQALLRDLFAMSAMSGFMSRQSVGMAPKSVAEYAYQLADAMLAARQTTKTGE